MKKALESGAAKPYISPKISHPEIIGIVPLAALAATTVAQMFAAGALVGGAAAGAGALATKAMGITDMKKINVLRPIEY